MSNVKVERVEINPDPGSFWETAMLKAWQDDEFNKKLEKNPRETLLGYLDKQDRFEEDKEAIKASIEHWCGLFNSMKSVTFEGKKEFEASPPKTPKTYLYPPTCC